MIFFPSCDVQEEADSIDCSFTCSHFETVSSPSWHLQNEYVMMFNSFMIFSAGLAGK